jgi:hypothetical protein
VLSVGRVLGHEEIHVSYSMCLVSPRRSLRLTRPRVSAVNLLRNELKIVTSPYLEVIPFLHRDGPGTYYLMLTLVYHPYATQDSFRLLLQTQKPGSSASPSGRTSSTSKPYVCVHRQKWLINTNNYIIRKTIDASQPAFKPRKVKKASEPQYRDRAAERRQGGGNDYAEVSTETGIYLYPVRAEVNEIS